MLSTLWSKPLRLEPGFGPVARESELCSLHNTESKHALHPRSDGVYIELGKIGIVLASNDAVAVGTEAYKMAHLAYL